jgi:hypothetical protein
MSRSELLRPPVAPFDVAVVGGSLVLGVVVAAANVELPLRGAAVVAFFWVGADDARELERPLGG